MGMRSGKVLKGVTRSRTGKAAKPVKRRVKPKTVIKRQAAPRKVVTRTVEVDPNRTLRDLARRIVDLTIANDEPGMLALYAANVESKEAAMPASTGIDAIKAKFEGWRNMVTDATFVPVSITADGNVVMIEWSGRVTLAATGRLAELDEIAVHEIRNGKIVKERFYYDPSVLQG